MRVREVTYRVFEVQSESNPDEYYRVWYDPVKGEWNCTCPAFRFGKRRCKHIASAVRFLAGDGERW